jgi:hypothetical protein
VHKTKTTGLLLLTRILLAAPLAVFGCEQATQVDCTRSELSARDFLLKNYTDVAIATDLEPDDVLALAILFEEANRIYEKSSDDKYPIDLIIVGEGNTTIKRMRMEKLLQDYFHLPPGVNIKVVEGRAAKDNIFLYDGDEFFEKETLERIPFPEANQGQQALDALNSWAEQAQHPFIIQLKPASELLYLDSDLAKKTTVLFYGGFNIRKTALDPEILNDPQFIFGALPTIEAKLEALMLHFSSRFSKIAILEAFGVLGDQSCVCSEYTWTNKIGQIIKNSDDKFMEMFRTVSSHWNAYILDKFLNDCQKISIVQKISTSDVQFTLSDVLVAMATVDDSSFFQTIPIKTSYDANGFLVPISDAASNIVYYNAVDREKLASSLERFLNTTRVSTK